MATPSFHPRFVAFFLMLSGTALSVEPFADEPAAVRYLTFQWPLKDFPSKVVAPIDFSAEGFFVDHMTLEPNSLKSQQVKIGGKSRKALTITLAKDGLASPKLIALTSIKKWCDWDFVFELDGFNPFHHDIVEKLLASKGEAFEIYHDTLFVDNLSDVANNTCSPKNPRTAVLNSLLREEARNKMVSMATITFSKITGKDILYPAVEIPYQGAPAVRLKDLSGQPTEIISTQVFLRRLKVAMGLEYLDGVKYYRDHKLHLSSENESPLELSARLAMLPYINKAIAGIEPAESMYLNVVDALKRAKPYVIPANSRAQALINFRVLESLFNNPDGVVPENLRVSWLKSQNIYDELCSYRTMTSKVEQIAKISFEGLPAGLLDELIMKQSPAAK